MRPGVYEIAAPARRVALPLGLGLAGGLTADGKDLVEAALAWAVDGVWAPRTRVMLVGDAITGGFGDLSGYREPLAQALNGATCDYDFVGTLVRSAMGTPSVVFDWDHEGHGMATTGTMLSNINGYLQGNLPDVVLIHLGVNDLRTDVPVATIISNLEMLVSRLRAENNVVSILVAQIIPAEGVEVTELNQAIAALEASLGITVVDQATDYTLDMNQADGIHPNVEGQAQMADVWFEALRPLLACAN